MEFDLVGYINRQIVFSKKTFGPGNRTLGIIDHIRKELKEIHEEPTSLEWIDVIILAIDGCWRAGYSAKQIVDALEEKLSINQNRAWPDWRKSKSGKAIEHIR